jgi:hypothetical protein
MEAQKRELRLKSKCVRLSYDAMHLRPGLLFAFVLRGLPFFSEGKVDRQR